MARLKKYNFRTSTLQHIATFGAYNSPDSYREVRVSDSSDDHRDSGLVGSRELAKDTVEPALDLKLKCGPITQLVRVSDS